MPLFKTHIYSTETVLRKYFEFRNETKSLDPLAEFLESLRYENIDSFLDLLRSSPDIAQNFSHYLFHVFHKKPFNLSLTEADILSENSFFPELKKRILDTLLPQIAEEDSVWYIIDYISVSPKTELEFMEKIPAEKLNEIFRILQVDKIIMLPGVKRELILAANILAWRVIGNVMDVGVLRMAPEFKNLGNPFLALQNEMDTWIAEFTKDSSFEFHSKNHLYKQLKIYLSQAEKFVDTAFRNSSKYGISGKINQSLIKIRQQLQRISHILEMLVIDKEEDYLKNSKNLIFSILRFRSRKNNLRELVSDSTVLISHLITNHTAETGVHYITSSYRDYVKMFWKASGGGVIVGFLCILKLLYGYMPSSEFGHAALYAFNYAMGFIMIYLMNFTLATKQPAMTAATMAKVLAEDGTGKNYTEFAHLVSKLFRSQFIAFVGNVLWAFPVALCIVYGADVLFGQNIAADKADKLLTDLDPIKSKAVLHACIAGFYLFLSGIIAGNIGNNAVFYQIPKRITNNRMLTRVFGNVFTKKMAGFYERNWAGIVSNFWFGVFLGVTGPIGKFFGLDLDIRHITFAAGNLALGLYGSDFVVSLPTFVTCLLTVFLIGFLNFAVSFGLSMALAFRSRKVKVGEAKEIYTAIFSYFVKHPLRFFLPIRSYLDTRAKEMMEKTVATKPPAR